MTGDPSKGPDPPEPSKRDPRKCTAHSSRTGLPCERWAIHGGTTCATHGGRSPQVKATAVRRLQRAELDGQIGGLLAELETEARSSTPVAALLDAVHRSSAMAQVLGAIVGELTPAELYGPNHLDDAVPHIAVTMYQTWLDRAARAAKLACDAGVDEKLVRAVIDYRFEGIDPTLLT